MCEVSQCQHMFLCCITHVCWQWSFWFKEFQCQLVHITSLHTRFGARLMDVFGDAVCEMIVPTEAPSQYGVPGDGPVASGIDLINLDSDDADDPDTTIPAAIIPGASQPCADLTPCALAESHSPPCKKQKRSNDVVIKLLAVEMTGNDAVKCVFVANESAKKKYIMPVPLWSQYEVAWKNFDFKKHRWIVVGNWERWVMQIVDVVTNGSVRQVAKAFTDYFKKIFLVSLAVARKPSKLKDAFCSDSDDDTVPATGSSKQHKTADSDPTVIVSIGGFDVTVVNHAARVIMLIDKDNLKFISDWVVPMVRQIAKNLVPDVPETGSSDDTASVKSSMTPNFNCNASPTPNWRDKVCWNPLAHTWVVLVKKRKDLQHKPPESYKVDSSLSAAEYDVAKLSSYIMAIDAWNKLDGSSRHRIPQTATFPELCASESDGSQPK